MPLAGENAIYSWMSCIGSAPVARPIRMHHCEVDRGGPIVCFYGHGGIDHEIISRSRAPIVDCTTDHHVAQAVGGNSDFRREGSQNRSEQLCRCKSVIHIFV